MFRSYGAYFNSLIINPYIALRLYRAIYVLLLRSFYLFLYIIVPLSLFKICSTKLFLVIYYTILKLHRSVMSITPNEIWGIQSNPNHISSVGATLIYSIHSKRYFSSNSIANLVNSSIYSSLNVLFL